LHLSGPVFQFAKQRYSLAGGSDIIFVTYPLNETLSKKTGKINYIKGKLIEDLGVYSSNKNLILSDCVVIKI